MMTHRVSAAAIAAAWAGSAAAGPLFTTQSDQGSANGQTIEAFTFEGSLQDVYAYQGYQFAGNGGPLLDQTDLLIDAVNLFLVQTSEDGLGLFAVFDNGQPDNEPGAGTNANNATGSLTFSPVEGLQDLVFQDDNGDNPSVSDGDPDPFNFDFDWANGFTDGFVSTFDTSVSSAATIRLDAWKGVSRFNIIGANGNYTGAFDDFGGVGDDGSSNYVTFVHAVPTPTAVLAGASMLAAGLFGTRRRTGTENF